MWEFLKLRAALWILSFLLLLDVMYIIYNIQNDLNPTFLLIAVLVLGLILGTLISIIVNKDQKKSVPNVRSESSHTVMESMQRVFKIVTAEGHFNEIYDYKETSKLFKFFPSTKKALVIVKGKVQLGYDFSKAQWEIDEKNKKIKLIHFPAPEITSIDTDFEYYNIEEKFYNLFSKNDLANIHKEGKKQIHNAALKSHLPQTAAEQIELILNQLLLAKDWELVNTKLISNSFKNLKDN